MAITRTTRISKLAAIGLPLDAPDDLDLHSGYMARALVQATLPHSDPKTTYFERRNGSVTLSITGRPNPGLPYGKDPRLILAWICTEAVRTKSATLNLGRSLSEFARKLQMHDTRSKTRLRSQAQRLFSSMITIERLGSNNHQLDNIVIAKNAFLFWDTRNPDKQSLWASELTLNSDFYAEITQSPVPVRLDHLRALGKSPMEMDIYTWITYRTHRAALAGQPVTIPWPSIRAQIGAEYGRDKDFRDRFREHLKKVLLLLPNLRPYVTESRTGLQIKPPPKSLIRE